MYKSPIDLIVEEMELKLCAEVDHAVVKAVQDLHVSVDKSELLKALKYDRDQYNKGYADGEWELFELISSAAYGKRCYSLDDGGMVYSRLSHKLLKSRDEAITEWMKHYIEEPWEMALDE